MRSVRPGKGPEHLEGDNAPGAVETMEAEMFFRVKENKEKNFPFKAYKHSSVKDALNELFHFKCAYCESSYAATQPVDIEHYRPKGGYLKPRGKLKKPGYHWLAAKWTNLLPCCTDCNRPRYQPFPDDDPEVAGKANKFPLRSERSRARRPGGEENEARLLLNPYFDKPAEHLFFTSDGIVKPRRKGGAPSEMATASIDTYALQRCGLVERRRDHAKEIAPWMSLAERSALELQETGSSYAEENLREALSHLKEMMLPDREYTTMAEQMIKPFMRRIA
jgi:uncharacterized protein (TIGR02646 family)